jgi:membrane glycosyltransferase
VAGPLLLALPLVVWAGRPALGQRLRRAGLLLTPEETAPHRVLRQAWAEAALPAAATLAAAAAPVGEVIVLRAAPAWARAPLALGTRP